MKQKKPRENALRMKKRNRGSETKRAVITSRKKKQKKKTRRKKTQVKEKMQRKRSPKAVSLKKALRTKRLRRVKLRSNTSNSWLPWKLKKPSLMRNSIR